MVSYVYYGELTDEWKNNWGAGDEPYDMLKKYNQISFGGDGMGIFSWAKEHCSDEVQVDWGSYAWKCRGEELIRLSRKKSNYVQDAELIDPEKEYGVVFIEIY